MNRRDFVKSVGAAGLAMSAFPSTGRAEPFEGQLLLTINALGGWDISNFCDPKGNWMNERYDTGDIESVGPINYAPLDKNREFFQRFGPEMLLINGIDMRTSGHFEAARHVWSGHISDNGTPSIAALFAARHLQGFNVPTPYISYGGFSRTGDLVPLTRLSNPATLQSVGIYEAERGSITQSRYVDNFVLEEIFEERRARHELASPQELPRFRKQRSELFLGQLSAPLIRRYQEYLPDPVNPLSVWETQTATAMACLKAGLGAAATVYVSDFDTHSDHENRHQTKLIELLDTITFAVDRAAELGISDRLTILITSEFSRTPEYGLNGGKDHWPTNSMMLMGPGITGNRVIGATDDGLVPRNMNLETLEIDDDGERLYPGHLHTAIREHLDLTEYSQEVGFDLRMPTVPLF